MQNPTIRTDVHLAEYTTFHIGGPAKFFCEAKTVEEIKAAYLYARNNNLKVHILGGGSNTLFRDEGFDGLVIKIDLKGIEWLGNGIVKAMAGEDWDAFVAATVQEGYWGLENLSAIPGTVGAAPVQNIGAYGAEVALYLDSVEVLEISTGELKTISKKGCAFLYRSSIFKENPGHLIVTAVIFKLSKNPAPNIAYKDITEYFSARRNTQPTLSDIRNAIIEIRAGKLPDLKKFGTAGSFFKNLTISEAHMAELSKKFEGIPSFPAEEKGMVKVPLAWILDKVCGYKGYTKGNAGVYENQALVLVNRGGATSEEIRELSQEMIDSVSEKTGITPEPEVVFVDF